MLQEKIKAGIKEAMIAKDSVRLDTLRGISAACTNEVVSKGKTPQDTLSDDEVMAVLMRLAKQRRDSISQFNAGGRPELAAEEEAQLAVIEAYLPKMMSEDEIKKFAEEKLTSSGMLDKSKMGQAVGLVMKDLKGKADGALVKKAVEELLA